MPTEVRCARCEGPTPIGIGTPCPKCGSFEKMTVSTLGVPNPAPMIRTRTAGPRKGRTYPLRGGLPVMSTSERTNPIAYHQRKVQEIEYKMPAPILGVFAPDSPAWERISKKREEFVNLYRTVWGSNAGLSTERINEMSERDLDQSIRSLRRMNEQPERPIEGPRPQDDEE